MLEKSPFHSYHRNNWFKQKLDQQVRVCWGKGYVFHLQVSPHKVLITYKGKNMLTLPWRNLVATLLKWSKFPSATRKQKWHDCWCEAQRTRLILVAFLPKIHNLNLISRKHQMHPNWETRYKIKSSYYKKKSHGHLRQKACEELPQMKRWRSHENPMQNTVLGRNLDQKS